MIPKCPKSTLKPRLTLEGTKSTPRSSKCTPRVPNRVPEVQNQPSVAKKRDLKSTPPEVKNLLLEAQNQTPEK